MLRHSHIAICLPPKCGTTHLIEALRGSGFRIVPDHRHTPRWVYCNEGPGRSVTTWASVIRDPAAWYASFVTYQHQQGHSRSHWLKHLEAYAPGDLERQVYACITLPPELQVPLYRVGDSAGTPHNEASDSVVVRARRHCVGLATYRMLNTAADVDMFTPTGSPEYPSDMALLLQEQLDEDVEHFCYDLGLQGPSPGNGERLNTTPSAALADAVRLRWRTELHQYDELTYSELAYQRSLR